MSELGQKRTASRRGGVFRFPLRQGIRRTRDGRLLLSKEVAPIGDSHDNHSPHIARDQGLGLNRETQTQLP